MVDKKNLNRIKGILSARLGAEIPKYDGGAKFAMYGNKQTIYSPDRSKWFLDANLTQEYTGSLAGFKSIQVPTQPKTEIPGANPDEGNPQAALNAASSVNAAIVDATLQKTADATASLVAARKPLSELPEVKPSLNMSAVTTVQNPNDETVKTTSNNIDSNKDETEESELKPNKLKNAQAWNIAGQATTLVFNALGDIAGAKLAMTDSTLTRGIDTTYDGIADVASNFGPIGQAVGSIMKIAGTAGDLIQEMGGGTDQQTTMDKWMDSSFFSWNIGMLNGFAGKNTDSFELNTNTIALVGSSYGGTVDDLNDAAAKADKKYGLFSSKARKKVNTAIANAKSQQNLMGDIADSASDQRLAVLSMGEQAGLAYSIMTDGGYSQKYTYAAKHGGIIEWNPVIETTWEPQIELNWELPEFKEGGNIELSEELEWIPELKDGGKTHESDIPETEETTQKNVIPEGALHKNKHHMEHAEGLTKKGIPVIDEEGEQQAEIEHSEIIFTLEVTKKLEEYYDIFYSEESSNKDKDQAAIDAGKLLVYQILENTEDRTGLIDLCKRGGSLTLKKSTDDVIEEMLEWMPALVDEEIKEEPKKKSDKEQLKETLKELLVELLINK